MKRNFYKKICVRMIPIFACFFMYLCSIRVEADMVSKKWIPFPKEEFYFQWEREEYQQKRYLTWDGEETSNYLQYYNYTNKDYTLQIKNKNPEVLKIQKEHTTLPIQADDQRIVFYNYMVTGVGKAVLEYRIGNEVYEENIYVTPGIVNLESMKQTGYQFVKLTWNKVKGVSGYAIQRTLVKQNAEENWKTIQTVSGENTTSAVVTAGWNKTYKYRILGFVEAGTEKLYGDDWGTTLQFKTEKTGAKLKSVKKAGDNALKITWKKDKYAIGYKIYRSETENDGYKCVKKIKKGNVTSWKQKITKGKVFYYRIVTVYPGDESELSPSIAQMIPIRNEAKIQTVSGMEKSISGSKYGGNWANPDRTFYYQKSGNLHMVLVKQDGNLADYTLDSNGQVVGEKIINLSYEQWGGFYKAPDGNFYVAVGYGNFDESKTATVIKVIQYNSNWEEKKTAEIKGGASNIFEGIFSIFDIGNCTMTMQGDVLHLFTARTMFENPDDGLRHQSNISFVINTKSMKVREANESYCSHSFHQLSKFKDGNLYLTDHGDAYPRGIYLNIVNNYKALQKERYKKGQGGYTKKDHVVFSFLGETGENYTGATIGGMEIGKTNVLICGTSVPHGYGVYGVTGYGKEYGKNVYVVVTNKETGKSQVKWLTDYDPSNSNSHVSETRMVKLNEDRYAILYTEKGNTLSTSQRDESATLKYVVVNGKGKKVYSKDYTGMELKGGSQPILYNGNIVWTETFYTSNFMGIETILYSIPAVW